MSAMDNPIRTRICAGFLTYRFPNGKSRLDTVECTLRMSKEIGVEAVLAIWWINAFCFNQASNFPCGTL